MNIWKTASYSMLFGVLLVSAAGAANAGQVHRCDNCTYAQKMNKALTTTPLGSAYVADIPNAELTMWEVRHDGELRMKTADQTAVDPAAYNMFLNVLSDASAPKAENGRATLILDVSAPPGSRFASNPLSGFEGYTAYDFSRSGTLRSQLGTSIANSIVGGAGNIGSPLGSLLLSLLLNYGGPIPSGYTIVITWGDGSKTTFVIEADDTSQAKYVAGASTTPEGVPIPDSAINTDAAGGIFTGEWNFSNVQSLEDWINAMAMNGVPITGQRTSQNKVACVRVDGVLSCEFL